LPLTLVSEFLPAYIAEIIEQKAGKDGFAS